MRTSVKSISILMADDDADDRMLMKKAFEANQLPNILQFVENGAELLDYLKMKGKFLQVKTVRPHVIFLDLNMPKVDGREALSLIKADPDLRRIPVIVLTTSTAQDDIFQTYDLGANSFISKPSSFSDLVEVVGKLKEYWFNTVALPTT